MGEWDMHAVLAHYGLDVLLTSSWRPVLCPFHDDHERSAGACLGGFKCLACGVTGDGIKVIMEVERCDFSSALGKYEAITGDRGGRVSKPVTRKSWGIPPFGARDNAENDGGFSTGVRQQPDLWT